MVESRKTALAGLLAILLYLPWLIYLPSQLSRVRWAYWIPQPGIAELVRTWLVFAAGLPVPQTLLAFILFGTVLATTLGVWGTFRGWRMQDTSLRNGGWLLYLAIAPVLLMFVLSTWQAVYLARAADFWGHFPALVGLGSQHPETLRALCVDRSHRTVRHVCTGALWFLYLPRVPLCTLDFAQRGSKRRGAGSGVRAS